MSRAYLAGLFDGEGNAGVWYIKQRKSSPKRLAAGRKFECAQYVPCLQLKMTDRAPVEAFHKAFGGCFGRQLKPLPSGKIAWYWRATHRKAWQAAAALYPYVLAKGPQLDKVLDYYFEYDPK